MPRKKILLLSPYDAISHRYWREGMVAAFPEYEWHVLTLPSRHFSWRTRGNSLTWAISENEIFKQHFDLIIATSMTDLSALKGMRPALASVPTLLYFHENQFSYPESGHEHRSIEPKITSIYAAISADRIAFNSDYNRKTFLQGSHALLNKMPDHVPPSIERLLIEKSHTLPVPLMDACFQDARQKGAEPFTILWNHRWEYDKAPERFFSALCILKERDVNFIVHVAGQRFRKTPTIFDRMKKELSEHIGVWGYIEKRSEYMSTLQGSHLVVSTALHDFQGLGVLEGIAAGCIPLVPDRLAYQEFIPDLFRYESFPGDENRESAALAKALIQLADSHKNNTLPKPPDISHLSWSNMRDAYKKAIESLL